MNIETYRPGHEAVAKLAARADITIPIRVAYPLTEGTDWNDVYAAEGAKAVVQAFAQAEPVTRPELIGTAVEQPYDPVFHIDMKKRRVIPNSQHNIREALRALGVSVRHDIFQDRMLISGLGGVGSVLDDRAMERLWLEIDEQFLFRPSKDFFWTFMSDFARQHGFHPVRDYLDALQWDRTPRLDRWLSTYGGADDSAYVGAIGALALIAAVRRVRRPGCKFDEMLVLESAQGTNKSSALATLAVSEEWFSDDLPLNQDTQRVIERTAGRWIVEAAELAGMRKTDIEHLKAFLSRRVDRARPAYGRMSMEVSRQFVVIGTTNNDRYLRDGTGNRRFWPVKVSQFDLEALARDRDQLWAEAAAREAAGESIRLEPALYGDAAAEQEKREIEEPFIGALQDVIGDRKGKLRAEDAWRILDLKVGQRTQEHNARLGNAMKALGFKRVKRRFGGQPEYAYVRGDGDETTRQITIVQADNGSWQAGYKWAEEPTP